MLRFLTAGESHGQALVMTLDGMPAGLQLDIDAQSCRHPVERHHQGLPVRLAGGQKPQHLRSILI